MTSANDEEAKHQLTIAAIPADIFRRHVFPLLGVRSIARCAQVCREWRLAVDSDAVWKPRCAQLWQGKLNVPQDGQSLYAFAPYAAATADKNELGFSVKELKHVLAERMVPVDGFMYKHEFLAALAQSQPPQGFPGWPLSATSKWKASYLGAFLRIKLFSGISKPELVRTKWQMEFNYNHQRSAVEFLADGSFSMPEQQRQQQQQDGLAGLRWRFQRSGREGDLEPFSHYIIQIGSYPPLNVSRDERWGFVLTNEHVVMRQDV